MILEENSRISWASVGPFLSAEDKIGPMIKTNIPGCWHLSPKHGMLCVISRHCVGFQQGQAKAKNTAFKMPSFLQQPAKFVALFLLRSFCLWNFPQGRIQTLRCPRPGPKGPFTTSRWREGDLDLCQESKILSVNNFLCSLPGSTAAGLHQEGTGHIPSIPSLSPLVCLLVLN